VLPAPLSISAGGDTADQCSSACVRVARSRCLSETERSEAWLASSRCTRTARGKYRFRLKASNGEVVAQGEAYEAKASAKAGCEAVQRAAGGAAIVEVES
jgi:uncharacterized protein YegP (UPF0339 family)